MPDRLKEADWTLLLGRIQEGKCTPFLGAGTCFGTLPLGREIAEDWASREGFPLEDCADLAKVAQFLSVKYGDAIHPKERIVRQFRNISAPCFDDPDEPHRVLAELPLPIYITTNYDDFLFQALSQAEHTTGVKKTPLREVCRWNKELGKRIVPRSRGRSPRLEINAQNPLVFHLHGHTGMAESMVLTEDDYLDFLINLSRDEELLPPRIQEAFTSTSLLFVGYSLDDWNFRVLFRSVVGYLEKSLLRAHISVQLVPVKETASEEQRRGAEDYLNRYFDNLKIRIYWGTAKEFARDLREHWDAFRKQSEVQNGN